MNNMNVVSNVNEKKEEKRVKRSIGISNDILNLIKERKQISKEDLISELKKKYEHVSKGVISNVICFYNKIANDEDKIISRNKTYVIKSLYNSKKK